MEFVPILQWMSFGGEEVEDSLQEDGWVPVALRTRQERNHQSNRHRNSPCHCRLWNRSRSDKKRNERKGRKKKILERKGYRFTLKLDELGEFGSAHCGTNKGKKNFGKKRTEEKKKILRLFWSAKRKKKKKKKESCGGTFWTEEEVVWNELKRKGGKKEKEKRRRAVVERSGLKRKGGKKKKKEGCGGTFWTEEEVVWRNELKRKGGKKKKRKSVGTCVEEEKREEKKEVRRATCVEGKKEIKKKRYHNIFTINFKVGYY